MAAAGGVAAQRNYTRAPTLGPLNDPVFFFKNQMNRWRKPAGRSSGRAPRSTSRSSTSSNNDGGKRDPMPGGGHQGSNNNSYAQRQHAWGAARDGKTPNP